MKLSRVVAVRNLVVGSLYMGVYFQNHRWPLVSKIWKPSKNHWKQWSGGWKSLNGDGWMTPKPLKNHRVQWSVIKKVVNGDGQRGAKPSKNHWCQWFSQEKTIVSHRSQKMTIVHLYPRAPLDGSPKQLTWSILKDVWICSSFGNVRHWFSCLFVCFPIYGQF